MIVFYKFRLTEFEGLRALQDRSRVLGNPLSMVVSFRCDRIES
jgi:hypothetical protein